MRGGWKPDVFDSRDWKASALFGAPRGLPDSSLDLASFVEDANDQVDTSSCVGQAIGKGIDVRLRRIGFARPESSCLGIYTIGRRIGLRNPTTKLIDDGCYPRDAMAGIRTFGVPSAKKWPFDPAKVDEDVPWDVLQDASRFLVFHWRIDAWGSSRPVALAQAISKGYPVVFGMDLWSAFFGYRSGTIERPGPESEGGHMMLALGYRRRADGALEFLILNSWGRNWGENGFCWLHEDVIAASRASDFYVIQVSP